MRRSLQTVAALSAGLAATALAAGAAQGGRTPFAEARGATGADVGIQLAVSTTHPRRGQRLTYVATLRNRGDEPAEDLELSVVAEFAPQDLHGRQSLPRLVSTSGAQAGCTRPDLSQGFSFRCPLGTIAAGQQIVVRFVVVGDAPASCAIAGKESTGARSCKLTMAATIRWRWGPNDNPQSPSRAVRTVSFTRPPPPKPLTCNFPPIPQLGPVRACYAVRIRATEEYAYTLRADLREELGCPGAPVVEANVSQRIEIVSGEQPVQVRGEFPVLLTTSGGHVWASGLRQGADGLLFRSRVTIVRNASGAVLDGNPDREIACAGGPVPVHELESADCGRRVLEKVRLILSYDGPGRFKTFVDGTMQPYRHCELNDEAGPNEVVQWVPIFQAVAAGEHSRREAMALTRRLFERTRVGGSFVLRGSYASPGNPVKRGTVVLSFRRLS